MDDLKTDPASACFLLLPVPTFARVTRPSSRRSQSPSRMSRLIRLTSTHKKRGAPDCFFCWLLPGFRFWQAGAWQRVEGASTSLRQDTSEPNPRLRDRPFDFHVTAALLGKIATAFCRGSQPERPGDVICGGRRDGADRPTSHSIDRSVKKNHRRPWSAIVRMSFCERSMLEG